MMENIDSLKKEIERIKEQSKDDLESLAKVFISDNLRICKIEKNTEMICEKIKELNQNEHSTKTPND